MNRARNTPAGCWSPGKSRQMYIGRQGPQWRFKVPEQFQNYGYSTTSRYMHSEEEAAEILRQQIEPLGLTLKDCERIGFPENMSDDAQEAQDVQDVQDDQDLHLLASVALSEKVKDLSMLLQKHKENTHRHHFGNPYMQVERVGRMYQVRVPPDLDFFFPNTSSKFPTAQQAHLHIQEILKPQTFDLELLETD